MIVPRLDHDARWCRGRCPNAVSSAASAGREQRGRTSDAEHRREQRRSTNVSSSTERSTWRARGAEHAQQRELLRALRDGHRERVEDQEAADEQRDAGEHEQRGADEAERVGEVLRPAARPASLPVRTAKSVPELAAAIAALSCVRRRRRRCATEIDVVAVVAGHALRLGQRDHDQPRAGEVVRVAERGDAGDLVLPWPARAPATVTVSPTLKPYFVGGAAVDRDLVVGRRRAALDVVERLEALLGAVGDGERRRAVGDDRLALAGRAACRRR